MSYLIEKGYELIDVINPFGDDEYMFAYADGIEADVRWFNETAQERENEDKEMLNVKKFDILSKDMMKDLVRLGYRLLDVYVSNEDDRTHYTFRYDKGIDDAIRRYQWNIAYQRYSDKNENLTSIELESLKDLVILRIEEDTAYGINVDKYLTILVKLNNMVKR